MSKAITVPSLRELMAAGAHFGHKKERSHPKAKQYIYTLREGIYIIDLQKTQEGIEQALGQLAELAKQGKTILFVGTKPQASELVKQAATKAGMPYIVHRWPGGLLTNFETVLQNLKQLNTFEAKLADPDAFMTKKERRVLTEKIHKASETLGGVREMKKLPDALFVVDVVAESTGVGEAYRLGIPIIGITDTNANPEIVNYPIPANDDATGAIELIVNKVAEVIAANKAVAPTTEDSSPAGQSAAVKAADEKQESAENQGVAKKSAVEETSDTAKKVSTEAKQPDQPTAEPKRIRTKKTNETNKSN